MMRFVIVGVGLVLAMLLLGAEGGVANIQPAKQTKKSSEPHDVNMKVDVESRNDVGMAVDMTTGNEDQINFCQICVVVFEFLDHYLMNDTERVIGFLFGKICSLLPASYQGECADLANQLVPQLAAILLEELIPVEVCKLLTVCGASAFDDNEASKTQFGTLKDKEVKIQHIADALCAELPFKYNGLCHDVMKTEILQGVMSLMQQPRN